MNYKRRETPTSPEEWVGKIVQVDSQFKRVLRGWRALHEASVKFATAGEFILIIGVVWPELPAAARLRAVNARGDICWIFPDEI